MSALQSRPRPVLGWIFLALVVLAIPAFAGVVEAVIAR